MNKGFVLRTGYGLRRFADGTKRATVLRATQAARLRVGQLVTATVAGAGLDCVRLPLRIEQLHELPNLGALPAAARRVGVRLAGLRINHDDRPPTPNNTTERHSR